MVSLISQILGLKSYFMFREFEAVTEIQPLPIKIDYNYYLENKEFFKLMSEDRDVLKEEIEKYLNEEIHLEYFVEDYKKLKVSKKEIGRASCRERVSSPV